MAPGAFESALAAGRKLLGGTENLEIRTARVPTDRLSEGFAVARPEAPEHEATAREVVYLAKGGEPTQPWTSAPGCTAAWTRGNPRLRCRRIRRRSTRRATPRAILRIHPTEVISWGLDAGAGAGLTMKRDVRSTPSPFPRPP